MSAAEVEGLGRIVKWPGGYAMTLGYHKQGWGVLRCCLGHETPEAARDHGIVQVIEAVQAAADRDVALWAEKAEAAS